MGNKPAGPQTMATYLPRTENVEVLSVPFYLPAAIANDATKSTPIFAAPMKCLIKGVTVIPQAAITGQNTDSFNWNLINKGTNGLGAAELANKDFVLGQNAVAFDELVLYAPATYSQVEAGTVLALERELVGVNGLATPEVIMRVDYIPVMTF